MASQFFGLNIGYTGLMAAQTALNVTGNNISNVETEGYSRQQAIQTAAKALRMNSTYGCAGAGVDTTSIDQIRNAFYDEKYWRNNSSLGIYEIKSSYMRQIEDLFTETDQVEGFNAIFDDMFNALTEVYKSGGDPTVKTNFISTSSNLADYFNSMYTAMQKQQEDANNEIKNKVDQINSIAQEIATLNKQINTIEITGPVANELRDKRAVLVDELSLVVDVDVTEIPIYTGSGDEARESGIYRYVVNIAGGQNLVDGYDFEQLECKARERKVNQSDADGLYDISWKNGLEFNLYGKNLGGQLKGLVEIRDGNNEEYFHGRSTVSTEAVHPVTGATVQKVSVAVTADYLLDMDKSTLNDEGCIVIGNKEFFYDEWEFDDTTNTYSFYLKPGADPTQYIGKEATIGEPVDYLGIPYYMEQMNEWIREFSRAMNDVELKALDTYGDPAEVLFTARNLTETDSDYQFADHYAGKKPIASYDDNYQKVTAGTFKINIHMADDVNLFGTTSDIYRGQDAQDIAEELLNVRVNKERMSFRGCTAGEFLQCLTADVALNAGNANTFYDNYTSISKSVLNQRLSVSGVDNDEEALSLVKYQEAFNLASKMIQVMTEVYDRLILETGV